MAAQGLYIIDKAVNQIVNIEKAAKAGVAF
jgi:hypothetical protein